MTAQELNKMKKEELIKIILKGDGRTAEQSFVAFCFESLSEWSGKSLLQGVIRQAHFRLWGAAPEFSAANPSEKSLLEFCRKAEDTVTNVRMKMEDGREDGTENASPYQTELETATERHATNSEDYDSVKAVFDTAMKAWKHYWPGENPLTFKKANNDTPF